MADPIPTSPGVPGAGRPLPAVVAAVTLLAVLAATLPRLGLNYGLDGDAIRGAVSAWDLWHTGRYVHSRVPGNPLFEYLLALVIPWGGCQAGNALVLAFHLLGVAGFARLVRGRPFAGAWTVLFALTPILLVNAASSMDYVVGLALSIWAYALVREDSPLAAGILAGMAIGVRLPNALLLPVLAAHMLRQGRPVRRVAVTCGTALGIGALCFLPIFARAGWDMLRVPPSGMPLKAEILRTGLNGIRFLGVLGTLGLLAVSLTRVPCIVRSLARAVRGGGADETAEWLGLVLPAALFALHGDESAYLIPVLPFAYLLLSRWLSRPQVALLGSLVLLAGLGDLDLLGGTSGRRTIALRPAWGSLVHDYRARSEMNLLRSGIGRYTYAEPAVVICAQGPSLYWQNDLLEAARLEERLASLAGEDLPNTVHRLKGHDVYFVYALARSPCLALQRAGFTLYMFNCEAPSVAIHKYGYKPEDLGITMLRVFEPGAFYRQIDRRP